MQLRFVTLALLVASTACSLLTPLSGLSGGDGPATAPGSDAGASDDRAVVGDGSRDDSGRPIALRPAYLFATGGAARAVNPDDPAASAKIFVAEIHGDGTLGSWKPGPGLPEPRENHAAVGVGSDLFILSGQPSKSDFSGGSTGFALHVLGDGGLTPFEGLPPLPVPTGSARAVAASGHVHAFDYDVSRLSYLNFTSDGAGAWRAQSGVVDAGTLFGSGAAVGTDVFLFGPSTRAIRWPVNNDGSLGPWTAVTAPPGTTDHLVITSTDRSLYMVGEWTTNSGRNDVFVAEILPSHELGPWVPTEPFPIPRLGHEAVAYGGYIYVLGGEAVGTGTFSPVQDVYFAKIGSDGKLGLWKKTSALPEYHAYAFALVTP